MKWKRPGNSSWSQFIFHNLAIDNHSKHTRFALFGVQGMESRQSKQVTTGFSFFFVLNSYTHTHIHRERGTTAPQPLRHACVHSIALLPPLSIHAQRHSHTFECGRWQRRRSPPAATVGTAASWMQRRDVGVAVGADFFASTANALRRV